MVTTPAALRAATGPSWPADRLVTIDPPAFRFDALGDLPSLLAPGDLLVLNDAATLPAAIRGDGWEIRLGRRSGPDRWWVGVLGAGCWATPTEQRPDPPSWRPGQRLGVGAFEATVVSASSDPHWVEVELHGDWLDAVYRVGEPVRYSYLQEEAPLAAFQTRFAARPWASESPSAALPLRWATLLALRRAGVGWAALTHAAGLSSVDGGAFDATFPHPERSYLPPETVSAVLRTRAAGGRVVAVGTTVVRALEGRLAEYGGLIPGEFQVATVFTGRETPKVVDGLLTKLHAPEESHFRVLSAFADPALLTQAFDEAAARGFRNHEFGDSSLILARSDRRRF